MDNTTKPIIKANIKLAWKLILQKHHLHVVPLTEVAYHLAISEILAYENICPDDSKRTGEDAAMDNCEAYAFNHS